VLFIPNGSDAELQVVWVEERKGREGEGGRREERR
jgi:hypothetical protein